MAQYESDNGCYIYRPGNGTRSQDNVPATPINASRLNAFLRVWSPLERTLENVLVSADSSSVDKICQWLSDLFPLTLDRIPTGLITTSTASSLLKQVSSQAGNDTLLINVPASQCNNLKSALKCIVSAASSNSVTQTRFLNYDLEALRLYLEGQQYEKVLLYFGNGESLHGRVLSDLIDVLDWWRDRIPFVLIFETAVSIDIFQEKLTKRALSSLRGDAFSTASAGDIVEAILKAATTSTDHHLWMGANPASMLIERQAEHLQSAHSFVMAIKYMHMIHFYRNPLSGMLAGNDDVAWTYQSFEAARKVKSFQTFVGDLGKKKSKDVNKWTKNESELQRLIKDSIKTGMDKLAGISKGMQLLKSIHEVASNGVSLSWSRLYILAMSGQLRESTVMRNLLLTVRSMTSETMQMLLPHITKIGVPCSDILEKKLDRVIADHGASGILRSEHDKSFETMRTTVVAKKISLSKQKLTLSKGDSEYSALVEEVSNALEEYLDATLISPKSLLFNELFVFDLKVPLREAFAPRPRHAIEHALTVPGAYLACECCDPDQRVLDGRQPATSVLYQLFLESGTIVNIADLWAAFDAIIPSQDDVADSTGVDDQKLALFYQSLAELKYLGMVKTSKKKADHLVKTRFLGL